MLKKKFFQIIFNKLFNRLGLVISVFYFFFLIKKNNFISKEKEFFIIKNLIKKNSNVIDVGANVGRYTFELAKIVGPQGCVYSFEPMPRSSLILTFLIFLSNVKNIIFFSIALGNKTEKILMKESYTYKNENFLFDTNTQSQIIKKKNRFKNNLFRYSLKIDDLHIKDKISFIKIDTENYEYQVLIGAKKLIIKNRPIILIENNSDKAIRFLKNLKYTEKKLFNNSRNKIFYFENSQQNKKN